MLEKYEKLNLDLKNLNNLSPESLKNVSFPNTRLKLKLESIRSEMKNVEPSITKKPREENWAIVFNYKNSGQEWEIVTRKEANTYKVRVKKRSKLVNGKMGRSTQKINNKDTYDFTANDKTDFNKKLGEALDKTIWTNRDKLPKTGWVVYDMLNKEKQDHKESKETKEKTNLKKKPINLEYDAINKEKKIERSLPNATSVEWRISRCLRFSSITDAVEDRYNIPRGLLMAMMAQEWRWDPTVINQRQSGKCDWWAGLIHIQAINAADYWMKTLDRYNKGQIDYKHWEELQKAKRETNNDLSKLSKKDDRFNPIMSIDLSARFLMNEKWWKHAKTWDDWLKCVCRYAWRGMTDYWYSVLVYWTTINAVRKNTMLSFTKEVEKVKTWKWPAKVNGVRENVNNCIKRTNNAINNFNTKLDWKEVSLDEYYKYEEWQRENYGLKEYKDYNKKHPYVK